MGRFIQGNLNDGDVIACWLLSHDTGESFEKLVETRKKQKHEELVQLAEDVKELGISDGDFRRQAAIYLLSKQEDCTMIEASELFVKLEQERDRKPSGPYAKIVESMKTPSYGSPKPKSKVETAKEGQKEEHQDEVEWVRSGTVKLQSLKKKYQRR